MKEIIEITLEEYEAGAWVADVVSFDQFDGSFELAGSTWNGTMFSERQEFERWHTRIVGGKHCLAKQVRDKYYDGSVTLVAALQDIARDCGETYGAAQAGVTLTTYQRMQGRASYALDTLAASFATPLMWWIGRDGLLSMKAQRDAGPVADGQLVNTDVDASIELVNPENLQIASTYNGQPIRFIRWHLTKERFAARAYFMPFLWRAPTQVDYAVPRSARVDRQNANGTIDVITSARFGLTQVPLFSGVPGSKVEVRGGEEVTVGFFDGDPQKPYAVAMAQNAAATKEVARKGDGVALNAAFLTWSSSVTTAINTLAPGSITPITSAEGQITSGSSRLKVGD